MMNENVKDLKDAIRSGRYATKLDPTGDRHLYDMELMDLALRFRRDVITAFGLVGHPKADECFGLAWDHGYTAAPGTNGLDTVVSHFQDFERLLAR